MYETPERPEKDTIIWRYMSLDKYLDLLLTKSIKFTQLNIAADKLETSLMLNRLKKNNRFVGKEHFVHGAIRHIEDLKKTHYMSCWAGKEHECRSLWFAYLGESRLGVAIKTTVAQFLENVCWGKYGIDVRKVVYRDNFEDIEELQFNTTLINAKAPAYSSEAEIRFCINEDLIKLPKNLSKNNPPVQIDPNTLPKIISLELDLESVINEVWISPYCDDWQIEMICSLTDKLAPELRERMRRSDLYEQV